MSGAVCVHNVSNTALTWSFAVHNGDFVSDPMDIAGQAEVCQDLTQFDELNDDDVLVHTVCNAEDSTECGHVFNVYAENHTTWITNCEHNQYGVACGII